MQRTARMILACLMFSALTTPATAQPFSASKAATRSTAVKRAASSTIARVAAAPTIAAALDDDIPGVPIPASPVVGALDAALDVDDVFAVDLVAGERLSVSLTAATGTDFDIYLFGPDATSVFDFENMVAGAEDSYVYPEWFNFDAPVSGTYYLDVWANSDASVKSGEYELTYQVAASPKSLTKLTLEGPERSSFASATISGYLTDASDNPLPDMPVFIGYAVGSGEWDVAALVFTDSDGFYTRKMSPKQRTSYQTYFAGDEDAYIEQLSDVITVLPKARLTRTTSWSSLGVNKTYYAKGYIEPYHRTSNSNKVKIRAYKKGSDGDFHYVKSFTASYVYYSKSKTAYKAPVKLTSKGTWMLKAYHATDTTNYKTYGSPDYLTVK